jgi:hypothetical protein
MILNIEIDTCDDYENIDVIFSHLYEIERKIKRCRKGIINNFNKGNKQYKFSDNNCYGTHEVIIKKEG